MFSAIITGLKLANWLNWIVAIVLTGFFALLLADAGGVRVEILAGRSEASREATRLYLYTVLSIVPPTAIAVHMLLTRLVALVRDAAAGMAFTTANAVRLRMMGWALLAINIADLVYGWVSIRASEASGEYFGWSLSLTGWVAVPLLFVLAHVFREGAAMRQDLEGTV